MLNVVFKVIYDLMSFQDTVHFNEKFAKSIW